MRHSQNPGGSLWYKLPGDTFILQSVVEFINCSAADRYVEALSEIITVGKDLRLMNLQKAWRKLSSIRLLSTSRWMAVVLAQVNRQM